MRIVPAVGVPQHFIQRGNNKRAVFSVDDDQAVVRFVIPLQYSIRVAVNAVLYASWMIAIAAW